MTNSRKPSSFHIDAPNPTTHVAARSPRAIEPELVTHPEIDIFDVQDEALIIPPPPIKKKRSVLGSLFFASFGILLSLSLGLWVDGIIRDLFTRSDWLGWFAAGVATLAATTLLVLLARELIGLAKLSSVERFQEKALQALTQNDAEDARKLINELSRFVATNPATAAGRRVLEETKDDIIDGSDLIKLAETELLGPLDIKAQTLILDAAKRVSVVTAVSPRALVDLAYVLFESGRLIRRLAELYGGRPGALGFIRLLRNVLAHMAVTGAVAAGDEFVHQIVGQGLAARLSAKLGEGVVNGMMTARIGVAAMETVRPMPFTALKRPGLSDFLAALSKFSRAKGADTGTANKDL